MFEIIKIIKSAKVIAPEIPYSEYVALDLSVSNEELHHHTLNTAHDYEVFIQNHLDKNHAKIAYGGYLERRNLYKRSTVLR